MEDPATSVPSSIWTSLNSYFTSTVFFILLNLMIATIVFTSNLSNNNNNQQEGQQQDDQQQEKRDSHDQQTQPQIVRSPSILNRLKSFNFNTLKSQPGSDPETYYQENPLEVAATQYVFNQPLHYQHFDLDTVNPGQEIETRMTRFDFDPTHQEKETTRFDYNPISSTQETETVMTHFEFEPTRQQREVTHFDFEPTHEEIGSDSGFEDADEFESLDEVYSKLKGGGGHVDRTKSAGEVPAKIPVKPPAGKMKKSASLKVGFSNVESEQIVEARRPATVRERKKAAVDHDDVEVDAKADDFINKFKNDLKLQRIESMIKTKGGKK